MKLNKYFPMLLICLVIILSGFKPGIEENNNVVAAIGKDYRVTFNDLKQYVVDWFYYKKFQDINEAYNKALYDLITNQLKCIEFFERRLDTNKVLIQGVMRVINEQIVTDYFNTQILGKYTTEDFARKNYSQIGREVIYRQISLYKPEKASAAQIESLKNKADLIKGKIKKEKDFEKIAGQYSGQNSGSNADSSIIHLKWEQSISDPVNSVIFNLKAGDTRVVEGYNAFYIVKVMEVKKTNVKPFNEIKSYMIEKLKNAYMEKSLREYDDTLAGLIDKSSLKWNEKALNQLVTWSRIPNFYSGMYEDSLKQAISDGRNTVILTYSQGEVDLKEYLRLLNDIMILKASGKTNIKDIEDFILEAVRTDKLVKIAQKYDLIKNVFNAKTTNPILRNKIIVSYNQAVIDSQIPAATSEKLQEFYAENRDSLYYQLQKVNIYAMVFPDKEKAEQVMQKIKDGTAFEKISGSWQVKSFIRNKDGSIASYLSKEEPYLGKAAFNLKLNETDGPIEYDSPENGKQFAVVKCVSTRPKKQLLFSDVEKTITDDFKNYHRKLIEAQSEKSLREKYGVEIYNDVLQFQLSSQKK